MRAVLERLPHARWRQRFQPHSRYIIGSTKQEVYDTVTGITWQRCPYGWFVSPEGKSCLSIRSVSCVGVRPNPSSLRKSKT